MYDDVVDSHCSVSSGAIINDVEMESDGAKEEDVQMDIKIIDEKEEKEEKVIEKNLQDISENSISETSCDRIQYHKVIPVLEFVSMVPTSQEPVSLETVSLEPAMEESGTEEHHVVKEVELEIAIRKPVSQEPVDIQEEPVMKQSVVKGLFVVKDHSVTKEPSVVKDHSVVKEAFVVKDQSVVKEPVVKKSIAKRHKTVPIDTPSKGNHSAFTFRPPINGNMIPELVVNIKLRLFTKPITKTETIKIKTYDGNSYDVQRRTSIWRGDDVGSARAKTVERDKPELSQRSPGRNKIKKL